MPTPTSTSPWTSSSMDSRMPADNDNFARNNLFNNSQPLNAYDNLSLFQNGTDSNFNDAGWSLSAAAYPDQSRGQQSTPSWQQSATHLSTHTAFNGHASPYGRALNQSPVGFNPSSFNNNLTSQQPFPYRQSPYDPALVTQSSNGQNFNLGMHGFNSPAHNGATITPQALEREAQQQPTFPSGQYNSSGFSSNLSQATSIRSTQSNQRARAVDQRALAASIPTGADSGMFTIINFEGLAKATNSERMTSFANVGTEPVEFDCSRMALPMYVQRRSRNDIRAAAFASGNTSVLAKIGKKSANAKTSAINNAKTSVSSSTGLQQIKYEEESSSTEDSSSDSAYSDDDDSDSPLPAKRPDDPKGGVEYDTIKALWRSKRKTLAGDVIRKSLVDFWELVKTIRDRWKADAQAVTDAETKKRMGELPLLQSRVKDQRDMIEAAFKAAIKHGHRAIIELFSENVALLYLCYQFLLDRVKAEDFNGALARAILETMSLFTTMTKEKIEKTHLVKVLPRFQKKGDAKTQYWVKRINANAEVATKEAAEKPEAKKTDKQASSSEPKTASPARKPVPEGTAGVKRAATSSSADGAVHKKVATGAIKPSPSTISKSNGIVKKPLIGGENSKAASATASAAAPRKTVVAKPSGFFSNLQSASKKPGTSLSDKSANSGTKPAISKPTGPAPKPAFSFAETMANLSKPKEEKPVPKPLQELPPETNEQREKRLRKEKRRKLHVRFKSPEDLVDIRYFTHDPDEEIDHDSSQMRDVADVGGEGRMFKQQSHMMDIDDDDDVEEEDLHDHPTLSTIDFSVVDAEERKRNYAPFGGGQLEITSDERSVRDEYEKNSLIVFYTDRSQIPANPREPTDPYNGDERGPVKYFAPPDEQYATRARAKRSQTSRSSTSFANIFQPQQAVPTGPDIQSILASLRQSAAAPAPQPTHPQPPQAVSQLYQSSPGFQTPASTTPAAPPANIDLAAILASLNPGAGQPSSYVVPNTASLPLDQAAQQQQTASNGPNEGDLAKIRAKNPNYKTKACRFWQEGRCQKGESCSYLHE